MPRARRPRKMAELNLAYAKVRTQDLRDAYDRARIRQRTVAVAVEPTPGSDRWTARTPQDAGHVDFGRYRGWTISQLARHDPDYLRWLSRHSSGIRFRRQIDAELRQASAKSA